MRLARIFLVGGLLVASLGAAVPANACGYNQGPVIGSNDCTGGPTSSDRAALDQIRAREAALRAAYRR